MFYTTLTHYSLPSILFMPKVYYGFSFYSSNDAEVGNNKSNFESPSSTRLINDSKSSPTAALHTQLLGNFKGFSIKPLVTSEGPPQAAPPSRTPIRPAPSAPPVGGADTPKHETPTANGSAVAEKRLQISRPVLDATTSSTARELVSLPPLKPAPPAPAIAAVQSSTAATSTTPTPTTTTDNKSSGGYPTLRRITSFMKNQKVEEKKPAATAPRANAKFTDRELLKNLEISEPILQNEINVPAEPLPLEADQRRAVVLRAHSLRAADVSKHRPSVHAGFGSMRRSTAAKNRPTSGAPAPPLSSGAACPARPTSPPPPLPDPSYQQRRSPVGSVRRGKPSGADDDDSQRRDHLHHQSVENIYSVIDENPVVVAIADRDDDDSDAYKVPRPLESSLLGEIVSAIQERNNESIYTNKRPDELQQQQQTYVNVPVVKPPSPGYVRPVDIKSRRAAYDRPDLVKNCDENRSPTTMMMNRSPDVLDAKKQPTAEKPTVASIKPLAGGAGVKPTATATVGLKKKLSDRRQSSSRTGGVADIQRRFENAAGAAPKKPPVASKPTAAR